LKNTMHLVNYYSSTTRGHSRHLPYLHKPAIVLLTSFLLWHFVLVALAAPILIMTSFSLWHHSLLSWPRPPLQRYGHLTAF